MAELLACIELAAKRFESGNDTEHDLSLLKKYGEIDLTSRTVTFNLPSIAEKTGLHEIILSTRLHHGLGMSAAISTESHGWYSVLSNRSPSKRASLARTGQNIPKKLNGPR